MTIKDLAAQTGYAVGTISRVLNNHPNVSEKARTAILKAVEESGFELNVNAKQLKQSSSTTILVIVKGIGNELFSDLMETIQPLIAQTKYTLSADYIDEESNEVRRAVQLCREKKPIGILFLGGSLQNFRADFSSIDVPCVLVTGNASSMEFKHLSSVTTDDREASRQAIESLIELGHQKIVVIGGHRSTSDISRLRYEGCAKAFADHNIPFDQEKDYRSVRFSYDGGYRATTDFLKTGRTFTAMYAVSDVMAIGAIRALRDNGLRVPEDVSVMSMDGLGLGSYLVPQLASIGQNASLLARQSVEILLDGIEKGACARHQIIPFTVNKRESIRCISE